MKPVVVAAIVCVAAAGAAGLGWYFARQGPSVSEVGAFHRATFESVPEEAHLVMSFDLGWFIDRLIDDNLDLFPVERDPDEVRALVGDASKKHFGVDLLAARRAVLWVAPAQQAIGVLIEGDFDGELKGKVKERDGVRIVNFGDGIRGALLFDGLLLGNRAALDIAVHLSTGKGRPLAENADALAQHQRALDEVGDGIMVVSGHLGRFGELVPSDYAGLTGGGLAIKGNGGVGVVLLGKESTLAGLVTLYERAREETTRVVDQALAQADAEGPPALAVLLTLIRAKIPDVFSSAALQHDGEVLTLENDSAGGFGAVYLGMAAAVAVPAFTRYLNRAKEAELEMRRSQEERQRMIEELGQ